MGDLLSALCAVFYWFGAAVSCHHNPGWGQTRSGSNSAAMIYHLIEQAVWQTVQASGHHVPPSLASEGFIHFSRREQVAATANRFYRSVPDLLVLEVDPARLAGELREEAAADGAGIFPHLYGPLPLDAVVAVVPLSRDTGGDFVF